MGDLVFQNPKFDALRSALYHTERRRFLDLLNKAINFVVILLSAGTAAKGAKLVHLEDVWLELGVVFVATLQLVFDFGGAARLHEFLQRRYYEVLAEIEAADPVDDAALRKWSARLVTLTADEPMTMRALDAVAYNKALDAVATSADEKEAYRQHVSFWQTRFRHVFAYQNTDFKPGASATTKS